MHFNSIEEVIANDHFQAWYFRNNEAKAREWEEWLLQHQSYVPLVKESIGLMNDLRMEEKAPLPDEVEAAHQKLQNALDAAPVAGIKPKRFRWWLPAAAAALLVLVGFAWWYGTPAKTKLGAAYGNIREYRLPDGSQVTLNANSEVVLGNEWQKKADREIWLRGEAFFKVQKTPRKNRFIVHATNMDIIVTGTQFNIVSREEESSVLLTEGSVILRTKDGKEWHMKPGDFVRLENNEPAKITADQQSVLAWKQSKLNFENTSMNNVAKIITRHYGVEVHLASAATGEKKISGIMPNNNLDVLIEALGATGEFKISKANNEIIISDP